MKKTLVAMLALSMIAVTVPGAAAGGTSSRSDTITPFFATPTVSAAHQYTINLTADTSLDATLSWEDEQADLDLLLTPPGSTCNVLPNPEVDCLAASADRRANQVSCQTETGGQTVGLGPASETITTRADDHDSGEATYSLWVLVSTSPPLRGIHYDLTLTTGDDGHQELDNSPTNTNLIRSEGHCRDV